MFFGSKILIKKRLPRLGFLILFTITAAGTYAQAPDFIKGGPFGVPPAGAPDQKIINKANLKKTKDENKPKVLDCEEDYEVDVTLTQSVKTCEGFDFQKLYDQTKEMADQGIAEIKCPADEECFVPIIWYSYWHWGCVDGTHATVEVRETKSCQKPNAKMDIGVGDGGHLPKNKPQTLGGPPPKEPLASGEFITVSSDGTWNGFDLVCGSKFLASYTYEVATDNANALEAQKNGTPKATEYSKVKDFKPYFQQAEQKAREYHDRFKCKETGGVKCKLLPFKDLGGDIQVNGGAGTVTIIIYFEVECTK